MAGGTPALPRLPHGDVPHPRLPAFIPAKERGALPGLGSPRAGVSRSFPKLEGRASPTLGLQHPGGAGLMARAEASTILWPGRGLRRGRGLRVGSQGEVGSGALRTPAGPGGLGSECAMGLHSVVFFINELLEVSGKLWLLGGRGAGLPPAPSARRTVGAAWPGQREGLPGCLASLIGTPPPRSVPFWGLGPRSSYNALSNG